MRPKSAHEPSSEDLAKLRAWQAREADIVAGKVIPTYADRKAGHSCYMDSALLDWRQVATLEIGRDMIPPAAIDAMNAAHGVPSADNIWQCHLETRGFGDVAWVCLFHAAIRGHKEATALLAIDAMVTRHHDRTAQGHYVALAVGLMTLHRAFSKSDGIEAEDLDDARNQGFGRLITLSAYALEREKALDMSDSVTGLEGALEGLRQEQDAIDRALEDRGEVEDSIPDFSQAPAKPSPTLNVFPRVLLLRPDSSGRKTLLDAIKPLAGKAMPLVTCDRMAEVRATLRASYPHCHAEIDRMLLLLAGRSFVNLRVLLVGEAGSGKTSLAEDFARAFGVYGLTFNAASAADSSFAGTSAQYASMRMATPLQTIVAEGIANPLIVVDEIGRIASGNQNGNLGDALLGFLEPRSSRHYFDPALETKVDLSAVSYIATTNDLESVQGPLRDRLRVIRIPQPGWQHIGSLMPKIIGDIAKENELDPRFIEPLGQDEMEILRQAWPGGSLRQLHAIVDGMLLRRDNNMGMH